jgi:hypothetical protein
MHRKKWGKGAHLSFVFCFGELKNHTKMLINETRRLKNNFIMKKPMSFDEDFMDSRPKTKQKKSLRGRSCRLNIKTNRWSFQWMRIQWHRKNNLMRKSKEKFFILGYAKNSKWSKGKKWPNLRRLWVFGEEKQIRMSSSALSRHGEIFAESVKPSEILALLGEESTRVKAYNIREHLMMIDSKKQRKKLLKKDEIIKSQSKNNESLALLLKKPLKNAKMLKAKRMPRKK